MAWCWCVLCLSQRGGKIGIGRLSKNVFSHNLGCSTLTPTCSFLFVCLLVIFFKFLVSTLLTKLQFLQGWFLWRKPVVERVYHVDRNQRIYYLVGNYKANFILAQVEKPLVSIDKFKNTILLHCVFWYLNLNFNSY